MTRAALVMFLLTAAPAFARQPPVPEIPFDSVNAQTRLNDEATDLTAMRLGVGARLGPLVVKVLDLGLAVNR